MAMTRLMQALLAITLALGVSAPARADLGSAHGCTPVQGHLTEIVADTFLSPLDAFGRVVSSADGTLHAVGTAVITGISQNSDGTITAQAKRVFVINPKDEIVAVDAVAVTPIANSNDADDTVTMTIIGGLGKFAHAYGQIVATGRGFNFFPFPPGPLAGNSYFFFQYQGEVCVP